MSGFVREQTIKHALQDVFNQISKKSNRQQRISDSEFNKVLTALNRKGQHYSYKELLMHMFTVE